MVPHAVELPESISLEPSSWPPASLTSTVLRMVSLPAMIPTSARAAPWRIRYSLMRIATLREAPAGVAASAPAAVSWRSSSARSVARFSADMPPALSMV